jgi:UDP-N-acetylmuramate--alanine ligase
LPFYGLAVLCYDDQNIQDILPSLNRRIITYGFNEQAYCRAANIITKEFKTSFDVIVAGQKRAHVELAMVGYHNVLNCLAAICVLEEIGVRLESLLDILKGYNGVKRRFTAVSNSTNFLVIDDYAHHPTEIKAVLSATRRAFPEKKVRVIFQPHRFSRTRDLAEEFGTSFLGSDSLVITEVYPAGEKPLPGIDAQTIINSIKNKTSLAPIYAQSVEAGAQSMVKLTEKHDIILVMGAGSITDAAPEITKMLTDKYGL